MSGENAWGRGAHAKLAPVGVGRAIVSDVGILHARGENVCVGTERYRVAKVVGCGLAINVFTNLHAHTCREVDGIVNRAGRKPPAAVAFAA